MKENINKFPKRKDIRLQNYDYSSNGYYFVTICTDNNKPNIAKYRQEVEMALMGLPARFCGISVDYRNLMHNHIHMILVFRNVKTSLGQVIRTFKALVSKTTGEKDFWKRNYYEHVIKTEKALSKIREYIQNNPLIDRIRFEQFYE